MLCCEVKCYLNVREIRYECTEMFFKGSIYYGAIGTRRHDSCQRGTHNPIRSVPSCVVNMQNMDVRLLGTHKAGGERDSILLDQKLKM